MRILKVVQQTLRVTPAGGRVLEVSCGAGKVLQQLRQAGCQVTGTNYSRYDNEPDGIDIRHGVDVLHGLPFDAAAFDTVLLLDVIEHVADHDRILSELARVCAPGGHVIILTPNMMKIGSRLAFLYTGFFKVKRSFIGFDVAPESAFTFHNHPVHLPVFLYQLQARGWSLAGLDAVEVKLKSWLAYGLFGPGIALATWLKVRVAEKNLRRTPAAGFLRRCLLSPAALCGETLMITARKTEGDLPLSAAAATALPVWSRTWHAS